MSGKLLRGFAVLACRALLAALPAQQQSWGLAIRREIADIPDGGDALLFALSSAWGLVPGAIAAHARCPRRLMILCAFAAVTLGIVYMMIAGAPDSYLFKNAGALAIGLAIVLFIGRLDIDHPQRVGMIIMGAAIALLATALLGQAAEGAVRWVSLVGVALQPSLIFLPVMMVAYSRTQAPLATAGVMIAAIALALQPDRAMAGMLVVGLTVIAALRPDRHVIAVLAVGLAGFAVTLVRPDSLPTAPFVDQILYSSFGVHPVAGMAVLCGLAFLLVPAIIGWVRDTANAVTYATFGGVWFAAVVAAAVGNYPTPIVGYGASAIIGYAICLLALPKSSKAERRDRYLMAGAA
jgi:hypothetical protein